MRPGRIRPGKRAAESKAAYAVLRGFNEAGANPPRKVRVPRGGLPRQREASMRPGRIRPGKARP